MKLGNIEHDVDYNVETTNDLGSLEREVDSVRLSSLAAAEELHQLLVKNKATAEAGSWQIETMIYQLEKAIVILRAI